MTIIERIKEQLQEAAEGQRVSEVRIGLAYTAVGLADGRLGVAYTYCNKSHLGCSPFRQRLPLAGRQAGDLLSLLGSPETIESAVGLATANALAAGAPLNGTPGDVLQSLALQPGDRLGMIGYFAPVAERLRNTGVELLVFEHDLERGEHLLPAAAAAQLLPTCTVALITSATLINNTIEHLLPLIRQCRAAALAGASTPLLPEAFQATPITVLSGIRITCPATVMQAISEGGGAHDFRQSADKINVLTGNQNCAAACG